MSNDEELNKQLEIVHTAMNMAAADAQALEKLVSAGDDSLEPRLKLLGYYWRHHSSSKNRAARIKHIAWMISNQPSHFVSSAPYSLVDQGIDRWRDFYYINKLWREQAKRHWNDAAVVGNAGSFFILNQSELAEKYFRRAQVLEPENTQCPTKLSQTYKFMGPTFENLALSECEKAYLLCDSIGHRMRALIHLPELAYEAGDYDKTVSYAADLFQLAEESKAEKGWQFQYPFAIEAAHTALGRLALRQGDVSAASQHLLQALPEKRGEMDALSPDSQLVAELFAAGERAAVLEWIKRCKQYLQIGDWKERVERNDSPWFYELPHRHRYFCLSRLPRSVFNSGDFEKAERLAYEFIEMNKEYKSDRRHTGFGLHTAYNVLGQLALRAGDLEGAMMRLGQAGSVPDADRLKEHGPDFYLAAELTKLGETESVCKFLKDCKRLWGTSANAGLLKGWNLSVAEGHIPDDWQIFLEPIDENEQ